MGRGKNVRPIRARTEAEENGPSKKLTAGIDIILNKLARHMQELGMKSDAIETFTREIRDAPALRTMNLELLAHLFLYVNKNGTQLTVPADVGFAVYVDMLMHNSEIDNKNPVVKRQQYYDNFIRYMKVYINALRAHQGHDSDMTYR